MNLLLLRHAIAVERGTPGYVQDGDRPLTPEGEKKMKSIAQGINVLEPDIDRVVSSPFLRARRTAELVVEVLGGRVEFSDALAPDGDARELIRQLQSRPGKDDTILLVGHEPSLSRLISVLLTGTTGAVTTLKKGGLCKLAINRLSFGPCATLEWLLTPGQLRLLR